MQLFMAIQEATPGNGRELPLLIADGPTLHRFLMESEISVRFKIYPYSAEPGAQVHLSTLSPEVLGNEETGTGALVALPQFLELRQRWQHLHSRAAYTQDGQRWHQAVTFAGNDGEVATDARVPAAPTVPQRPCDVRCG